MLSVALCTYNGARHIREQLNSILNQTLGVDEIVVCDDGSTDETLSIIERFRTTTNTCIRIYQNEKNLGVCANFQKAVDLCQGDIVFFSDQDDIWYTNKTETIIRYFDSHADKSVVFSNADLIDEQNAAFQQPSNTLWDYIFHDFSRQQFDNHLEFECFLMDNHATGATMAARKSFLNANKFLPLCRGFVLHDYAIAFTAVMKGELGYLPDRLMQYRIHHDQHSGIANGTTEEKYNSPLDPIYPEQSAIDMITDPHFTARYKFLDFRQKTKYQIAGPINILWNVGKYYSFYTDTASRAMGHDIKTSMLHSLSRFKKKIHG